MGRSERRVGEEKNQIDQHKIAEDGKACHDRHARTRSTQRQFLQRDEQEESREHDISPGPKHNVLPAQDANEFRPQRGAPFAESRPCRQREMNWMLPHVSEFPQRIKLRYRILLSPAITPPRYPPLNCPHPHPHPPNTPHYPPHHPP